MPRLIVVQGTRHQSFELAAAQLCVGAASGNDVVIADDLEVSKKHARIERDGERTFVQDLGSRNGTFVNEARVERSELRSGDRLRIGQTVVLYVAEDSPSSLGSAKAAAKHAETSASGRRREGPPRRDRLTNLLILQEINKALNSETDLARLLELIMDTAIHLITAERGFLVLVNEDRLDFMVARNIDYEVVKSPAFKVSNSVIRRVAKSGEPILTSNAQADLADVKSVVNLDLRSVLCVPL
jgi:adenylate cyclase